MALTLVLGGIRSGKSEHAERLAAGSGAPVVYLATGSPGDAEMVERIAAHRSRRPSHWRTVEAPDPWAALGPNLAAVDGATLLVDGLGGWVGSLMEANGLFTSEPIAAWGAEGAAGRLRALDNIGAFADAAAARAGLVVVVADETGLGGVPRGAASRRFADLNGEATRILAAAASEVWLLVAGQPVALKPGAAMEPATAPPASREEPLAAAPARAAAASPPAGPAPVQARPAPGDELTDLRLHGDTQVPPGHLDFAVNVVPGGPPPSLARQLEAALRRIGTYPDPAAATAAIAARHRRRPEEVLVLNGAAEAFPLIAAALRPRRAVCVHPSFTEPEAALRAAGVEVARAFRDPRDFHLDPASVDPGADLVVTGNPNNPTGNLDPAATLAFLTHPDRLLVVDEAFMDLVPAEAESLAARRDLPGVVVVRSLTKAWGLPGVRAGYLLGPPEVVDRLAAARQPWSVNTLALAALEACGSEDLSPAPVAAAVASARAVMVADLASLDGVRVWPSVANFLLVEVRDGPRVREGLSERGIAVRRCETFPGLTANHLRIAVRRLDDNARLVDALAEVL